MNNNEQALAVFDKIETVTGTPFEAMGLPEEDEKLQVSIIGEPQENLLGVMLKALSCEDLLNTSFLRGYRCTLTFGDALKLYLIEEGKRIETNAQTIEQLLLTFGEVGNPLAMEIVLPAPLLEKTDIRLLASDNDFADITEEDICQSDYCFMALRATAVLSMSDRKILRKLLIPEAGESLGVLVLLSELVPDQDKEDVYRALEVFFKGNQPIYYPSEKAEEFLQALSSLTEQTAALREKRVQRIDNKNINAAKQLIAKAIADFTAEEEKLEDALELLQEKAKALPDRQAAASRRSRMKYISPAQVEYADAFSKFKQLVSDTVKAEIDKGSDIQKMQNMIPGYLQNEWKRETERVRTLIQSGTEVIQKYLVAFIEEDIRAFLEEGDNADLASYLLQLTALYPDVCFKGNGPQSLQIEQAKDYSVLKKTGAIAAGLTILVAGHPLIGAGLAAYGFLKAGSGDSLKVLEQNRASLKEAADNLNTSYYDAATEWLDKTIRELNENVNKAVEGCYSDLMDGLFKVIQARKADSQAREKTLEELKQLEADIARLKNDIDIEDSDG